MGAMDFWTYAEGDSPREAFRAARERALWEHGHGGYTGTIAEKHEFVMATHVVMSKKAAQALASTLIDPGVPALDLMLSDKWGPAGCIEVERDEQAKARLWLFFGVASS